MKLNKKIFKCVVSAAILVASATVAVAEGANIFVIGGKADDPFFAVVKRGVEDAAMIVEAQGGSIKWLGPQNYDNLGADVAKLIRTAISQNPDAIASPNWVPEAMDGALQAVVDAGIPLLLYNAGNLDKAKELGALNYIGSDELIAGTAGGAYFATHGSMNVICVNTVPGAANLEARCQGVSDGISSDGGKSTQLPLPATSFGNPTAVAQAIKAALLKDDTIDGIMTISAGDANSAANAIAQAGLTGKVQLGTFDLDETTLDRIDTGEQLFAIDQQPYLQGFLTVSLLNSYVNYGLNVPTAPILTGPGIIDAANVKVTIAGVAAGVR